MHRPGGEPDQVTGTVAQDAPRRAPKGLAQGAPRRRHGVAGLLVVLFALAGLLFSYGLEHAPPPDICHPQGVAWLSPPSEGVHHRFAGRTLAEPVSSGSSHHRAPHAPAETCLCLAVLLGIMLLALAARPERWRLLLPARVGWRSAAPARPSPAPLSLASLQVLRL